LNNIIIFSLRAIQIGRVPVFLYTDLPWIPYQGSNISIETYGFISDSNGIGSLVGKISKTSQQDYEQKLEQVKHVRRYFTYPGVMEQIERFLQDPFGSNGGDLKCTKHPKTFFCCG
jgi:hypothetical protein